MYPSLCTIAMKLNYRYDIIYSKRYKAFYDVMPMKILDNSYFCAVVLTLQNQPKSFNDIMRDININPSTLNRRIKELTRYNLIEPIIVRVNEENRIKYKLTKKGEGLIKDLDDFVRLSERLERAILE